MKKLILLLLMFSFIQSTSYAQDAFKFREYLLTSHTIYIDTTFVSYDTLKSSTVIKFPVLVYDGGKDKNLLIDSLFKQGSVFKYSKINTDTLSKEKLKAICEYDNLTAANWLLLGCKVKLNPSTDEGKTDRLYINFHFPKSNDVVDNKYYLKIDNMSQIKMKYLAFSFSGQSIPFKYRSSFSRDTINVGSQMQSQFNAALSFGLNFGQTIYYYRKYEGMDSYKRGLSLLGFIGPSLVTIKKSNSNASENPILDETEKSTAVLSTGLGITLNVRNFSFGGFFGWDLAFGEAATQWNYHGKRWLGFGIGYSTSVNAIASALSFSPK